MEAVQSALRGNLPSVHPYYQSRFHRDSVAQKLSDRVLVGTFYCEESRMEATGVPGHIMLCQQFQRVEREVGSMVEYVKDTLRAFGNDVSSQLQRMGDTLEGRIDDLPSNVTSHILEHVTVEGAIWFNSRADLAFSTTVVV